MATPQITTVRQPKREDAYTVTETSTTTPKTVTTEYAAPSPEVQARIDAALEPAKKAYGVNPDGSMTPLSVLGYDPAKEARRRQREAELAEFKKKESGWYNGIALAMDAMTAGLGGNVYLRDVNKAKEAQQKQDQLRMEQKAEDAQNAQAMQQAGLSYGKWADAITRNYLGKMQTTTGGQTTKTTTHGAKTGYTTRAFSPSQMGEEWSKGKPRFVVKMHADDPSRASYQEFELKNADEYNTIRDILKEYYMKKVSEELKSEGGATETGYLAKLQAIGAMDENAKWKDPDLLMRGGDFYDLDDAVKKRIVKATGGKVKFPEGNEDGWNGGGGSSDEEYDF